ncbi:LytTR family DNA-binding domain-containing protein [Bifidobacterium sp. ESL0745]|uniref:LytTR family DNA-binding domain-containing protein n=1 Tax=Bifidobacterium sp. ESL0745 TaxID=2983226 RepID=UPI0023F8FF1D|nr:LytTR family DNA-binding domain-containing protein [Bifidobacterium sp. ESL0745]MDF7664521.1 LytTR family DNA-binding domain-containing protein [Bifidobacterium sp. ESL0745]
MSIIFRANPDLPDDKVDVIVEASNASDEVMQLLQGIKKMSQLNTTTIVVSTDESLELIPVASIIAVEVHNEMLLLRLPAGKTTLQNSRMPNRTIATRDTLAHFLTRLPNEFTRISRQTVININHLRSLKLSYSGNMTASLDAGIEETVGRRYVANLRKTIGA